MITFTNVPLRQRDTEFVILKPLSISPRNVVKRPAKMQAKNEIQASHCRLYIGDSEQTQFFFPKFFS